MKQILCLAFILLALSCKPTAEGEDQVETIDLSGSLTNEGPMNLSEIAAAVDYIALEAAEGAWITSVSGIEVTPRNIYVLDKEQNALIQFDLSGEFKRRIGVQGRGPQEYVKIGSFSVLSPPEGGKETVGIVDFATEYILLFDEQGNFVSRFKPAALATGISFLKDGTVVTIMHKALIAELNEAYSLNFYSREGELLSRARTTDVVHRGNAPVFSGSFRNSSTGLQYFEPYERSIYEIDASGEVKQKYFFDLGSDALPLEDIMTTDMTDKAHALGNIIETENYIFAGLIYQNYRVTAFYSKETKEATDVIFNYSLVDHGFHNDIDGGMPFWPLATTPDGKWISYFFPADAKRILSDPYYDGIEVQDKGAQKNLLDLINRSEVSGNPIIQITIPH